MNETEKKYIVGFCLYKSGVWEFVIRREFSLIQLIPKRKQLARALTRPAKWANHAAAFNASNDPSAASQLTRRLDIMLLTDNDFEKKREKYYLTMERTEKRSKL